MSQPTAAILGASTDRSKFGNKSVRAHLAQGFAVYPVNPKATEIEGLKAYPNLASIPVEQLDRISIYLPPKVVEGMLPEIAAKRAKEVWFNPGCDSPEVIEQAHALGIPVIQACSIVAIGVSPSQFADT